MKNNIIKALGASLFAALLAASASAIQITGQINIGGGTTVLAPAGTMLGSATGAGASSNAVVTTVEGSYPASLVGDTVTYKAFTFAVGAQAIAELWKVTDLPGANVYTFDLASITTFTQSANNVFLAGSGVLKATGFDPTVGLWTYNINSADGSSTNGSFSFQSNNVAQPSVPDGGSTVILLGSALFGLAFIARRKSLAKV